MKWIYKLERKLGKYAIPNLMYYIVILYGFGFALDIFATGFYEQYLSLNIYAVLHGEIWRLITFIIQPPDTNLLFVIFTLFLYYMIGKQLERVWGSFRFNLYFFTGVLFHILGAVLTYFILDISLPMGTYYLNLSLFLAYAAIYPEQQFYIFGILPLKVKWLAWIDAAYFGYTILQGFLPAYGGSGQYWAPIYQGFALEAFVSLLNFLLFFFATRDYKKHSPKQAKRQAMYRREVYEARQNKTDENGARHRCTVCGRTELDAPDLEFRYCSKCNGAHEYCQDHLFTHEHIK